MLLFVIVLIPGCAATSGNYCTIAKPIWWNDIAERDATPMPIIRQVVEHNETYQAICK